MARFYCDASQVRGDSIHLTGPDVNHIRNVLRMRTGDEITLSDGAGGVWTCEIASFEGEEVICRILDFNRGAAELPCEITLYQGLPKKDKMELVIQKAVELGAARVVPVMMTRTIVKLDDPRKEEKKLARWRQIAESAAKQSGRDVIPEITGVMTYKEALKDAAGLSYLLIPYENAKGMAGAREAVAAAQGKASIGIFIGPEGGITGEELAAAEAAGAVSITLGRRILRTETAGLAILSILAFTLEQ